MDIGALGADRCPHTRGGEPGEGKYTYRHQKCCPHTRGGEPPIAQTTMARPKSCPHTRGGELDRPPTNRPLILLTQ